MQSKPSQNSHRHIKATTAIFIVLLGILAAMLLPGQNSGHNLASVVMGASWSDLMLEVCQKVGGSTWNLCVNQ